MTTQGDVSTKQCDIDWCEAGCDSALPRTHTKHWPSGHTLNITQLPPGHRTVNGMQVPEEFMQVTRELGPFDRAAADQLSVDMAEAQALRRWCLEWQPVQLT